MNADNTKTLSFKILKLINCLLLDIKTIIINIKRLSLIFFYLFLQYKMYNLLKYFSNNENYNFKEYDYTVINNTKKLLATYNDYENSCVISNLTTIKCVYVTKQNYNLEQFVFWGFFVMTSFFIIPMVIILLYLLIKIKIFNGFGSFMILKFYNNNIPKSLDNFIFQCYYDKILNVKTCLIKLSMLNLLVGTIFELAVGIVIILMVVFSYFNWSLLKYEPISVFFGTMYRKLAKIIISLKKIKNNK